MAQKRGVQACPGQRIQAQRIEPAVMGALEGRGRHRYCIITANEITKAWEPIDRVRTPSRHRGEVLRGERFGGMLNYYCRATT
jgi:hypothetical protein